MLTGFCPIGVGCYSGKWIPGVGVGYDKKIVLHSFTKVIVELVFRILKLACEPWKWGSAFRLKNKSCGLQF